MNASLSHEALKFREIIITALWDDRRFGYIDQDRFIGSYAFCGFAVAVRFAGRAPRASLVCDGGCSEEEIVGRIGRLPLGTKS